MWLKLTTECIRLAGLFVMQPAHQPAFTAKSFKKKKKKKSEKKPVVSEDKTDILYCPVGASVDVVWCALSKLHVYKKERMCFCGKPVVTEDKTILYCPVGASVDVVLRI